MKRLATTLAAAAMLGLPAAAQAPGPQPQRPGLIQEQPNADTEHPPERSTDTGQKPWEPAILPGILIVGGLAYMALSRRKR